VKWQAGQAGHLLLGESPGLAQVADVLGQARGQGFRHDDKMAPRQCVGNGVGELARGAELVAGGPRWKTDKTRSRVWGGPDAELRDAGVRFLSIDPGEMDTAMHAEAMPDADRSALNRPEEIALRIADLIESLDSYPSGSRLEVARLVEAR
jgi:hypothetical protein